jgi:cysteine desulfurase NifS
MTYGPLFRLRERLIEPLGEARNDYLIMAGLADRLGYGGLYPQSEEALLESVLEGSGFTLDEVRRAGGIVRIDSPMMEYRKWEKGKLREDGKPGFDTPTGRFEIHSTILEEYGYEPLPRYVEPTEGPLADPELARQYPLVFNSGARSQTDFRSQHHGVPGLLQDHPEPVVEIHTADARARGIEHGDLVRVRTPRGAVEFRARVTSDIVEGAVECDMGGGTPAGPPAWRERNVNELTDLHNRDVISGFPVYKALLCEVDKVADGRMLDEPSPSTTTRMACEVTQRDVPVRTRVYLDNNATTPISPEVREAMLPYLGELDGNPSSIHRSGRQAREAVEAARRQIGLLIGASPRRIVFTGGGSEADNLAIKGIAFARRDRGDHIVTSTIEHPAVLATVGFLERNGFRITRLDADRDGRITPGRLRDALTDQTILVSIMMANNEVGTIEPIAELCSLAHERGIAFHTDAVQAAGKITVDVQRLGVDLLSLSAHKLHGPKGVGALYVRKGIEIEPLVHGGKQERALRAGTENVAAIVGFGAAAEIARRSLGACAGVSLLRDRLEQGIRRLIPDAVLNGPVEDRLPNTLNLTLPGLRGESLVIALDQHGIALSSGSACKSGSPEPTHVLLAMGRSEDEAHCSIRLSLSRETTVNDVDRTTDALAEVLEEMESAIRFLPCK